MERKLETKIVKDALKAAGINAVVGHGTGTAWDWLEINVGSSDQFGAHQIDGYNSHYNCPACKQIRAIHDRALAIAKQVTGRTGEYDGRINVLTQKGWNQKLRRSVEILQTGGVEQEYSTC